MKLLEHAVEVVHEARVVAVDEDLCFPRLVLPMDRALILGARCLRRLVAAVSTVAAITPVAAARSARESVVERIEARIVETAVVPAVIPVPEAEAAVAPRIVAAVIRGHVDAATAARNRWPTLARNGVADRRLALTRPAVGRNRVAAFPRRWIAAIRRTIAAGRSGAVARASRASARNRRPGARS